MKGQIGWYNAQEGSTSRHASACKNARARCSVQRTGGGSVWHAARTHSTRVRSSNDNANAQDPMQPACSAQRGRARTHGCTHTLGTLACSAVQCARVVCDVCGSGQSPVISEPLWRTKRSTAIGWRKSRRKEHVCFVRQGAASQRKEVPLQALHLHTGHSSVKGSVPTAIRETWTRRLSSTARAAWNSLRCGFND